MNLKVQKVLGVLFFTVVFCLFSASVATEERDTQELQKLKEFKAAYPTTTLFYRGVVAIDGNNGCADELYCDFGSNGLWVCEAGTWTKLNAGNPDWIMGFEHGSVEYLLCDFGSAGLWYWQYGAAIPGQFVKISSADPSWAFAADDDGDGSDEIIIGFGANGLWRYDMGGTTKLFKLHASNTDQCGMQSILWNPSWPDAVLSFGASGLWTVWNNSPGTSWFKINALSYADDHVSADVNSTTSTEELIIDFGSTGTWLYDGSTWFKLHNSDPYDMVAVYFGGGPDYELLCTFNSFSGLYMWNYSGYPGTWTKLSSNDPDGDGGFCEPFDPNMDGWEEVAVDFGTNGLWLYDHMAATKWTKLLATDPEFMIRTDYFCAGYDIGLAVDFGTGIGLWMYNGNSGSWTKLTNFSPDGVN